MKPHNHPCLPPTSKPIPQHLKHYEATQSSSSAPKSTYIHVVTSRVTNVVQSTPFMLSLCALLKGIALNIQSSDLMSDPDVVCSVLCGCIMNDISMIFSDRDPPRCTNLRMQCHARGEFVAPHFRDAYSDASSPHPFLFLESVLKVHHYTGDNKHGKVDLANSRFVNLWVVLLPPFV
jgi:hypothetical protein